MARNVGVSVENAFTRGLITEVTGVNSPENSVSETLNVSYDRRGRAIKRAGFEYEDDWMSHPINTSGTHVEYLWETVADNISLDFIVLQIGPNIYFYENKTDQGALSPGKKPFFINLMSYKTPETTELSVRETPACFTSGKGYLFVAHPSCETLRVAYNSASDTITVSTIEIQIRDFEGVQDGYPIELRSSTITPEHKYNLFNQGWYANARLNESGAWGSVFNTWVSFLSYYPSHKDVWWYYLDVDNDDTDQDTGAEWFKPSLVTANSDFYGNTPAAKGHYIFSAVYLDRSGVSGIAGLPVQSSDGQRPSVVAFYAGRAFYAGIGKSGYSQNIYFSQIVQRDDQFGYCYQKNDPTSREISDLLDDDGGVIRIPDVNTIYDLRVVGESIIVLASNGIWSISGTDSGPFKATDYTVSRLSTFSAINRTTVGMISGTPIWWNYEGIFTLRVSDIGLTKEVTSLTAQTIQAFYDDIPPTCKAEAKGVFNDQEGLMYWMYSDDANDPTDYSNLLILDVISGAFYIYSLPNQGPEIVGIVAVRSVREEFSDDFVVTNTLDQVTIPGDTVIISTQSAFEVNNKVFKFVTVANENLTFSEIRSTLYLDWGQYNYDAYFITGYRIRGELIRRGQTNYLVVIMEGQSGSSCFVQGLWDYSSNSDSNRFSNPQQVYRGVDDTRYMRSRIKMRGNGYSLQFKFFGQEGSPFTIIGWAGYESVSGGP